FRVEDAVAFQRPQAPRLFGVFERGSHWGLSLGEKGPRLAGGGYSGNREAVHSRRSSPTSATPSVRSRSPWWSAHWSPPEAIRTTAVPDSAWKCSPYSGSKGPRGS